MNKDFSRRSLFTLSFLSSFQYINIKFRDQATALILNRINKVPGYIEHVNASLSELIEGCKRADPLYQKVLYYRYYAFAMKVVFRYLYRYGRSADVVNDGFVQLFKSIGTFIPGAVTETERIFLGWLRRIMVNKAIDDLRKNRMVQEPGGIPDYVWNEPDPNASADHLVLYKELITEIKKLPPSYRAVFNMFVIDGYSHHEIAAMLGISTGTSKSSLSKARALLQQRLSVYAAERKS